MSQSRQDSRKSINGENQKVSVDKIWIRLGRISTEITKLSVHTRHNKVDY